MDSFDFSLVVSMAVFIMTVCIMTVCIMTVAIIPMLIMARMCLVGARISHTTFDEVHHSLSPQITEALVAAPP